MNRLVIILLPTILSIVVTASLVIFNLQTYILYINIFAGVTQLLMFGIWTWGDQTQKQIVEDVTEIKTTVAETKKATEEIRLYQSDKEGLYKKRERVLTSLIKDSSIPSVELNRIIKSIKKNGMFIITTSGGATFKLKRVLKFMSRTTPISIVPDVMYSLHFKRVYKGENVFIVLKEDLPQRLRNAAKLKELIYNEVLIRWKALQKTVVDSNLKGYEKWKDGTGFACNICVVDIAEGEVSILYKRLAESTEYNDAFSEEFKGLLMSRADSKQIGELVKDKVKAKEILKKQTISLLFNGLPEAQKAKLQPNDITIMKELKIKEFVDVSNINQAQLEKVLSQYISKEEATEASRMVLKERDEYLSIVKELNIF